MSLFGWCIVLRIGIGVSAVMKGMMFDLMAVRYLELMLVHVDEGSDNF